MTLATDTSNPSVSFTDEEMAVVNEAISYFSLAEYGGRTPDDDDYHEVRRTTNAVMAKLLDFVQKVPL